MTLRNVYQAALTEVNKGKAPCFILEDFNYFINKAINLWVNKRYSIYDTSLQTTDDLRVLKATSILKAEAIADLLLITSYGSTHTVILPSDYLHILNCVCIYNRSTSCKGEKTSMSFGARKLTADLRAHLNTNYYLKASYKLPYFYINNANTSKDNPTNPYVAETNLGTDITSASTKVQNLGLPPVTEVMGGLPNTTSISLNKVDTINRVGKIRYGNASSVRLEIMCGDIPSNIGLDKIGIEYLKVPLWMKLTTKELDSIVDTSLILEFPDYVCQEIINELNMLLLENFGDPRLQTNIPVSQSINSIAQSLTK